MKETNLSSQPYFSPHPSHQITLEIKPDESVTPGRFLPHPLVPNLHRAHPLTIRALRKDIFVQGEEEFSILATDYKCHSCNEAMDLQFWKLCPYCGAGIDY